MSKLFLRCPNCRGILEVKLLSNVTSSNLKSIVAKNKFYCESCMKGGLGKIQMTVFKFDWEREATSLNSSSTPTKLDPTTLSPEQIADNKAREISKQQ